MNVLGTNDDGKGCDLTVNLVKTSDFSISVDTGIVHIASAFDKSQVAFYEKAAFIQWSPIGDKTEVVFLILKRF